MVRIDGLIGQAELLNPLLASGVDLFIAGTSREERCFRWAEILKEKQIEVKNRAILYFREVIKETEAKETEDAEHFDRRFSVQSANSKMVVPMYDEKAGLLAFQEHYSSLLQGREDAKILVDLSVMIKPYFFILLRYLVTEIGIKELFLLYTEPASYGRSIGIGPSENNCGREETYFTRGTAGVGVAEIPSYSGRGDLRKGNALVLLLGFEGRRAVEVANAVSADEVIPINGFPAYRPEFKDTSMIANEELLRDPETWHNLEYAPANDPFETKNVLERIYDRKSSRYNLSIAPLGTKPMALGSCLFALEHPDVRVVYPYPLEYNSKCSKDCGNSWVYLVNVNGD